ncbi:MAG TPA: lysophospholipid acyltransferase family protein [Pirellulales bacterium]|jgi:1-acyl-sn-glycerol-3-phosphate acyltransferase
MADRSLAKELWYRYLQFTTRMAFIGLCSVRCTGRENEPATGGALVLSNHQSLFDPVLVGMTFNRRMNYMARETLFAFPPFRWLIQSVDAIPIDREGLGLAGLKETLRRAKRGEMVLIFPEGTRSSDGEVTTLKPGFSALAKRAKVPLIPVGIDGAYQAWPRDHLFPGLSTIHVHVGEPISAEEAANTGERELVVEAERRIRQCHEIAKQARLRAMNESAIPRPTPRVTSQTELGTHVA